MPFNVFITVQRFHKFHFDLTSQSYLTVIPILAVRPIQFTVSQITVYRLATDFITEDVASTVSSEETFIYGS